MYTTTAGDLVYANRVEVRVLPNGLQDTLTQHYP
jgi:hypothetical protein